VTEEAFVRAVVGAPGQDTPRLVYADWLDDHGDAARAAYLRAEVEWAAPWKTDTPPGWTPHSEGHDVPEWNQEHWPGLDTMLALAAPFDPVWVARVSRPPVGVCCDHLRFYEAGPSLTTEEISEVERDIGYPFPPALTAFLLHTNGGRPNRYRLVFRYRSDFEGWRIEWIDLDRFVGLARNHSLSIRDYHVSLEEFEAAYGGDDPHSALTRYVPFGKFLASYVLLTTSLHPRPGAVYILDLEAQETAPQLLVPSLPELLARIVTEGI
jgi:uncharacterized protein (TIGR02996 family)